MAERWRQLAFLCRYGHQDVFRLLGRDPQRRPLTNLELRLFAEALYEHIESEFSPREMVGMPSED